MNAGRRNDLLTFQARVLTTLPEGGKQTTWSPLEANGGFTEWAEAIRQSETAALFNLDYRSGITPASHRIQWDGAIWNIASVVHDTKRTMTTISSDFSEMIEVTTLESTEREFIDGIPIINT